MINALFYLLQAADVQEQLSKMSMQVYKKIDAIFLLFT